MPLLNDPLAIRQILEQDGGWAAYALADLDPTYAPYATWFAAPDLSAVGLLYREFSRPVIIWLGSPEYLHAVLDEIEIHLGDAPEIYAVLKPDVMRLLEDRYCLSPSKSMLRMLLTRSDVARFDEDVSRLDRRDVQAVQELYADGKDTEEMLWFIPRMLDTGVYYGIYEEGSLAAAAGTHVLAPSVGVGGLGNIYTRRDRRRRGYSRRVTHAVTAHLVRMGLATVALNVRADNHPAISVYERLGYRTHCEFCEVVARRILI